MLVVPIVAPVIEVRVTVPVRSAWEILLIAKGVPEPVIVKVLVLKEILSSAPTLTLVALASVARAIVLVVPFMVTVPMSSFVSALLSVRFDEPEPSKVKVLPFV